MFLYVDTMIYNAVHNRLSGIWYSNIFTEPFVLPTLELGAVNKNMSKEEQSKSTEDT